LDRWGEGGEGRGDEVKYITTNIVAVDKYY
jgi:hypothetical protein